MDARGSWVCAHSKETQWAGLRMVTAFGEPVPLVLPVTLGFSLHEHHSNIQMNGCIGVLFVFILVFLCWFVFNPNNLHSVLTPVLSRGLVSYHVLYTLVEICPPILITSVAVLGI